jgi:squalene-hopene/tetraprenyl-beta-curcumene cyclase
MTQTIHSDVARETLDEALRRSQEYFLGTQHTDGYWSGELETNVCMAAEYLLLTHFMGVKNDERWRKIVTYIRRQQRPDGTWPIYYGGPPDLNATVEAYFALKLAGVPPDTPSIRQARAFVLSVGGVPKVRTFTKIWLALFGQWDWKGVPVLPPELIFLPHWSPLTIYDFASWARATIVPMLIILGKRPVCPVPESARIDELYPAPRDQIDYSLPRPKRPLSWKGFFRTVDSVLRRYDRFALNSLRERAYLAAERWIIARQEADGSWAGIQPPWVYSLIALSLQGYSLDHPVIRRGLEGFESASGGWAIQDGEIFNPQACLSPVWDTALAMIALLDSGLSPSHPALAQASRWLLREQVMTGGDWQIRARDVEPGGWSFEFENDIYPDIDDTAEVLIALARTRITDDKRQNAALERGRRWLLGMQSSNGGWAAFDKDNTRRLVNEIPFCDFGEVIDPPSEDVTAHAIEALALLGDADSAAARRGVGYLRREQREDGSWWGRWGVNHIYGTGSVLPALKEVGEDMSRPYVQRAVSWLVEHQNEDGGWGESCASYTDASAIGRGPSTASQTAWALLALLAAGGGGLVQHSIERGVRYLVDRQEEDGQWLEPEFAGTGFPGDFYIKYHLYRNYWPLTALGRYRTEMTEAAEL